MTTPPRDDADVVVVGLGTAGAAVTAFLAERGLRVIALDRRPLDEAGARWVNGVPARAFRDAGVAEPTDDELIGRSVPFHAIAGSGAGAARLVIRDHDVLEVDMRGLVARLQARARLAGADLRGGVALTGHAEASDRVTLRTAGGPLTARHVIDASGLAGPNVLGYPAPAREHLCAAAQEVHALADPAGAAAFFADQGVPLGDVLGLLGVAGGFSVLNVRVHHGVVGILTGSIPALGHPSGKALLDEFIANNPWIGPKLYGGSAAIPLRRPHARLASDRIAALGDAASQVFAAHGSGIGAGLVAARLLADLIADGQPLRAYEVAWQRTHGGLFAYFDAVRRWSQRQSGETLRGFLADGLADEGLLRAGLDQAFPTLDLKVLPGKLRALLAAPRLAADLAATVARATALRALYARYPDDVRDVPAWERRVDWLLERP
jgi:flavin-dependent dehydrogenase